MRKLGGIALVSLSLLVCNAADQSDKFVLVAEGYTSEAAGRSLEAAYRMHTLSSLETDCAVPAPRRLRIEMSPAFVEVGKWFEYASLVALALDEGGHVIPRVPMMIFVEERTPPVLAMATTSDMSERAGLRVVGPGAFRLRLRAGCVRHEKDGPLPETTVVIEAR
jgi:hypothetical protein